MKQPPAPTPCIRAVAFDLDGTLVDTAPDLTTAVNAALTILGCRPLPETRIAALIGGGLDQLASAALTESYGCAPPAGALSAARTLAHRRYAERVFNQSRVYPGVTETLQALQASGMRLCCITNKDAAFALPLLAAARLDHFFAFILCAEGAHDRKPRPDLLLAACTRLAVTPRELLYIGDSATDVTAARAAGCPIVAVAHGYGQGDAADRVVACFSDIVAYACRGPAIQRLAGDLHAR